VSAESIRRNDRTTFRLTVMDAGLLVDLSNCTTRQIKFMKPSGAVSVQDAALVSDGMDGQMEHQAAANFLDEVGLWKFQAYLVFSGGGEFHGEVHSFRVRSNLQAP
jgi:hypothetical protein